MRGTYLSPAAGPPVTRWLRRLKFEGWLPSAEAADLLGDRLAARRRAWVCSVPGFAAAAFFLLHAMGSAPAGRSTALGREWTGLLAYLLATLSIIGWHELICRFDRRTGSRLPRRATRPTTATTRMVLGPVVLAGIAVAFVVQIVMGTVLFVQRVDLVSWAFVASCAVAWTFALVGVGRAVSRPMIAVDALTTAVDDRLRTDEAARACFPLLLATLAFNLAEGLSYNEAIYFLGLVGPMLVSLLIGAGLHAQRWAPRPAWDALVLSLTGRRLR